MHQLCCLSFFIAHFDIYISATHLPGIINVTADHLSRGHLSQVFQVTPTLSHHPTVILYIAYKLISPCRIDWISSYFLQLFQRRHYPLPNSIFFECINSYNILYPCAMFLKIITGSVKTGYNDIFFEFLFIKYL